MTIELNHQPLNVFPSIYLNCEIVSVLPTDRRLPGKPTHLQWGCAKEGRFWYPPEHTATTCRLHLSNWALLATWILPEELRLIPSHLHNYTRLANR